MSEALALLVRAVAARAQVQVHSVADQQQAYDTWTEHRRSTILGTVLRWAACVAVVLLAGQWRRRAPGTSGKASAALLRPVQLLRGDCIDPAQCVLELSDGDGVGSFSWVRVRLVNRNGTPHVLLDDAHVAVTISGPATVPFTQTHDTSTVTCSFSVHVCGAYVMRAVVGAQAVGEACRVYVAGPVATSRCSAVAPHVLGAGMPATAVVQVCDRFGNAAALAADSIRLTCTAEWDPAPAPLRFHATQGLFHTGPAHHIHFFLHSPGMYCGVVELCVDGEWTAVTSAMIAALSETEMGEVDSAVAAGATAKLPAVVVSGGSYTDRKVYVTVARRRVTVQYFYLGLLPARVHVCRVAPITLAAATAQMHKGQPTFTLGERGAEPITLAAASRSVILACFRRFVDARCVPRLHR